MGKQDPKKFSHFIDECLTEFSFKTIQFISDEIPKNEAGILFKYRAHLLQDDPSYLLVLRYKICCSFPLSELIASHKKRECSLGCGLDDDPHQSNNNKALLTVVTARLDQQIEKATMSPSQSFGMFAIDEPT